MKNKVTFLFGAGAEGEGNYNMPSGITYFYDTFLSDDFNNKIGEQLKTIMTERTFSEWVDEYKYRQNHINNKNLIYSAILRKGIILFCRTIESFKTDYKNDIISILTNDQLEEFYDESEIKEVKEKNSNKTDFDKELKTLLSKVNEKFEISRISPVLKPFFYNKAGILKFDESKLSISTAGVLDSYFHTIINPSKYGKVKFSIIMNYYWACYTCIVNYMIKNNKAYFSKKLDVDVSDNNECLILSRLEEVDKIISNMEPEDFNCNDDTYYNLIRARLCDKESNYSCCGILTTNYTPYVKDCVNDESKLVYLNGRIGLFEIPDITSINTLSGTLDSNRIFFPYVLGQSYVKPIINRTQIETYHRAVHILSETDCLIIIGYGINDDDSHINALIRDFTLSKANAKVIIVCRNESENDLRKKLRTNGGKMEIVHWQNKSNSEVIADVFNLM